MSSYPAEIRLTDRLPGTSAARPLDRQSADKRPWRLAASRFYFYGVLFFYAAALCLSKHPPLLQDYPTWVYEGVILAKAMAGHPDPRFLLKAFPVPNILSDIGLGVLCLVMSWQTAAKIWVVCYLGLSAFAYQRFLRVLKVADSRANWIIPSLCICNLCFWYGFINFQYGVTLMVLFCACLLHRPMRRYTLAMLLGLTFLCHAIPFAVCSLALLCYVVLHRAYRLLVVYVPVIFLGLWYLYGRFVLTGNRESTVLKDAQVPFLSLSFFLYKINCYFKSLGYVHPGIGMPSLKAPASTALQWALLGITAAAGLSLFYVFAKSAHLAFREHRMERFLWLTSAIALLGGLLCPSEALGISDPGSRFIVSGLVLSVLCSHFCGRIARVACWASATVGICSLSLFLNIAMHSYPAGMLVPPKQLSQRFASVAPQSRTYYYRFLDRGDMDLPSFDTAIFLNRAPDAEPGSFIAR